MKKCFSILFLFLVTISFSQEKEISLEDSVLGYYKGLYPTSLYNLKWIDQTDNYVFLKDNSYVLSNASTNNSFKNISFEEVQKSYESLKRLPYIQEIDATTLYFNTGNSIEGYNYVEGKPVSSIQLVENAANTEFNLKAKAIAYTIDNNLYIGTASDSKIAITAIEDENIVSGQAIHRSEFGITKGTFWSPNGTYLAFYQKDETNVTNYPLVDINSYPASLKNIKYPMAGGKSEQAKIGIYNLASKKLIYLTIDTTDEHYLTNLSWSPDEKYVFIAEVNRGQNHFYFNRYSVETGKKVNTIFEEKNDKWVEPEHTAVFIPNGTTNFLWLSERDGFMNLYEYTTEGKLVKQLTNFKWVIKEILGFSSNGKDVYISGTGNDGRETHTFKVNLKTGKHIQLTKSAGTHNSALSAHGNYMIDQYSSLTTPNNIDIIDLNKNKSTSILIAKNPLEGYKVSSTEFGSIKGVDGTELYTRLLKPANFDPSKKYPVLIYVYGGPHAQMNTNSWLGGANLWMNIFATNNDYLVFTVDNRGSENRGFAFESIIHRHLGDREIEDQLSGVDYLKSLPFVDANRIAVNGWSFGGFMTSSLMLRNPGVFTTAVAGGSVTDWKYYEVMYGERYMDTPQENPEGYENARVNKYIANLKGKLLLIHGSVDPVVVPQHSMTVLQEAVKQKVQLDFFTYPMHEHNVGGYDRAHLIEKMMQYIIENNN